VGQSGRFLIPKIVDHFRRQASVIQLGNLDVAREFSDVRDVAVIYRLLAEHRPTGETINLCSGQALSLNECLSLASEISGHAMATEVNPAFVRSNEIARLSGDRSKLESLIAAPAPRDFSETLRWMIQYLD
jgi:nucleoside-diphosphate-sugar epimerase